MAGAIDFGLLDTKLPERIAGSYQQGLQDDQKNRLAQLMMQQAQGENELSKYKLSAARRTDEEDNQYRRILAGVDTSKPNALMAAMPQIMANSPTKGFALQKQMADQAKAQADLQHTQGQTDKLKLEYFQGVGRDIAANPSDENIIRLAKLGIDKGVWDFQTANKHVQELLGKDPVARSQAMASMGANADTLLQRYTPKVTMQNFGNRVVAQDSNPVSNPGWATNLGGAMSMTPGEVATDKRGWAGLNQAESHFQQGLTAPQYMETDAGLVALPKKLGAGQSPMGTLVNGPDGQTLGKPLKPIPASVNTAIIANSQALTQIERALQLVGGADSDGMKGDAAATGFKGYLPNGLLNRLDPKGVDARALISDIGSLKIHDRSGAAVTVSEAPRLLPFIPLATDDAQTVKKKLTKLALELQTESQAMNDVYSRDQGYKPSPVSGGRLNTSPGRAGPGVAPLSSGAGWTITREH